jgi:large subunit ribosomal protein L9
MKVILLKDVPKIGKRYETKEVSDGYAANMLIPRGLAIAATGSAVKSLEAERAKAEGERKINEELLLKNLVEIEGKTIVMKAKGSEKGHLFAGVHKEELIAEIEKQTRLKFNPEHINLEKPIKEAGDHKIEVKGAGKSVKFILKIEATVK